MNKKFRTEKDIDIIKSFTINEKEKCIKCGVGVKGEGGFVLVQAGFSKSRDWGMKYEVLRKYPLCFKCWNNFNKSLSEDTRNGKNIIEKRIKKTIIKRLK